MSIELHCPQCEKLIRAPDNAGGKYGKCPYCETKVYIPAPPGEVIDLGDEVEAYVVAMRDSKLDDAERIVRKLKSAGARASDYVEGLMLDPAPPPLGDVPKPLMMGFLKSLLGRLG